MKVLIILMTTLLIGAVSAQTFTRGKRITSRAVKPTSEICAARTNQIKRFCNGDPDTICDSTGFVQCLSNTRGIEFQCGGDFPYCTLDAKGEAKCSKDPHESCDSSSSSGSSDFECLGEGIFPDASNCKKYFYCSTDENGELIADAFECDNFYVFDPSGPNDDYCRLTRNRWCVEANCKGTVANILLNYRFFPRTKGQFVACCRGSSKPLIVKCDEGFIADLNTLPVECNLNCRGAGKHANAEDETTYYECIFTGKGWQSKLKKCFRNYYFNAKLKKCEPKSLTSPPTTTVKTTVSTDDPEDFTTTTEEIETTTL